jgi:uncharacterized UPF0160 family protein
MKEVNKIFTYKDHNFNIKVQLNYSSERGIIFKQYSRVIINNMGETNWLISTEIENHLVLETIDKLQKKAIDWVDKIETRSELELKLIELGFK